MGQAQERPELRRLVGIESQFVEPPIAGAVGHQPEHEAFAEHRRTAADPHVALLAEKLL